MNQNPIVPGNSSLGALVTLTAAATGGNSTDQVNTTWRGLTVGINVSAITGTSPTLVVTIQGKDPASGTYYTLLASASITAAGYTTLTVYPGLPATANVSANALLPQNWRVLYAITGTTPAVTATVSAVQQV
ncbi:MAG: hypothetical protein ACYC3L_00915 [Gemmatimonadaceae bacterium]